MKDSCLTIKNQESLMKIPNINIFGDNGRPYMGERLIRIFSFNKDGERAGKMDWSCIGKIQTSETWCSVMSIFMDVKGMV